MHTFLAASLLVLAAMDPSVAQQSPSPPEKQANCRKASDMAVEQLRRTPAADGRDKARKDELEAKIVALIAENRRKGVDECTTWSQVMGLAFTH